MKQEPVAWIIKSDNAFTEIGFDDDLLEEIEQMYSMEGWKYTVIPLYTEPQYRELSDEEIDKAIDYATMQGYGSSYIEGLADGLEMANSILRKKNK